MDPGSGAKYGSEMLHKYGLQELEEMDNEPKYIEEPEEEELGEEIMSSTSNTTNIAYLVKRKKEIALKLVGDIDKINLLAYLIRDFREYSGRSVNYACIFYNYFKERELCDWPGKTEILGKLETNPPKSYETRLKVKS